MNVPDERERRRALRLSKVQRREAMNAAALAPLHALMAARLALLLTQLEPASIGFTWPYRAEFDAVATVRTWLTGHPSRWAALPVVGARGEPMRFRRWMPDTRMATDRYGIPYPAEGGSVVPALLLIPCNGFDARGYRLGYGAGHFDRTLAALQPVPRTVGIAIEDGRIDDLQPQRHDIPMDWIVTEDGTFGPFK